MPVVVLVINIPPSELTINQSRSSPYRFDSVMESHTSIPFDSSKFQPVTSFCQHPRLLGSFWTERLVVTVVRPVPLRTNDLHMTVASQRVTWQDAFFFYCHGWNNVTASLGSCFWRDVVLCPDVAHHVPLNKSAASHSSAFAPTAAPFSNSYIIQVTAYAPNKSLYPS